MVHGFGLIFVVLFLVVSSCVYSVNGTVKVLHTVSFIQTDRSYESYSEIKTYRQTEIAFEVEDSTGAFEVVRHQEMSDDEGGNGMNR